MGISQTAIATSLLPSLSLGLGSYKTIYILGNSIYQTIDLLSYTTEDVCDQLSGDAPGPVVSESLVAIVPFPFVPCPQPTSLNLSRSSLCSRASDQTIGSVQLCFSAT